jgi:hypothetical protein
MISEPNVSDRDRRAAPAGTVAESSRAAHSALSRTLIHDKFGPAGPVLGHVLSLHGFDCGWTKSLSLSDSE